MIGAVLLLVALGVAAVLGVVLAGAVVARTREREGLLRMGGADDAEIAEARRLRPALKRWIACSVVALAVLTAGAALSLKGCRSMRDSFAHRRNVEECTSGVHAASNWFGAYWDKHRKLPSPEEVPVPAAWCPLGSQFAYLGHVAVKWSGRRVLLVEIDAHPDGSHRALLADEAFLAAGRPTGLPPGVQLAPGMPVTAYGVAYHWMEVESLSAGDYEAVRQDSNRAAEKAAK